MPCADPGNRRGEVGWGGCYDPEERGVRVYSVLPGFFRRFRSRRALSALLTQSHQSDSPRATTSPSPARATATTPSPGQGGAETRSFPLDRSVTVVGDGRWK